MKVTRTEIIPDSDLARSQRLTTDERVLRTQHVQLLDVAIPVATARALSAAGAAAMLLVSLILAAVVLLGIGRSEVAKIHARYGVTGGQGGTRPQATSHTHPA